MKREGGTRGIARPRTSLRSRVTRWLVVYAALLSLAVFVHGQIVNSQAEDLTWQSLLQSELEHFVQRGDEDPNYRWTDTDTVQLYGDDDHSPIPAHYAAFGPGIHDGVRVGDQDKVILVREVRGRKLVLALDITELQQHEDNVGLWMLGSNVLAIVLLGLLVGWGLGRVLRPLTALSNRIRKLTPEQPGQQIEIDPQASSEQAVITESLNDYIRRNEEFVEREKQFINSVSHELRTPVAVIAGAADLASTPGASEKMVQHQLSRIREIAASVEELISILLVLAKSADRLEKTSELISLTELVQASAHDHGYLCDDRVLVIELTGSAQPVILAPAAVVNVVVGNLIRNAIENSDKGTIRIEVSEDAQVVIDDPGHGMSPEEISALYARMVKGEARDGQGIGLELIARLCGHLDWRLSFESKPDGKGTRATVDMSSSLKGL
ncbi:sensor histidine kinase [Stenotrophomonas sp. PD6]|uniref:sensor histidine kinase n=1 Tax=Stenotrophomonas sp. PD6 TaxID=3368612 RepID=UPI003B9EE0E4